MNSKITYRQQFTRCGKQRCRKCREGAGHGPYWYAYWSEKGRTVSKYIGTSLPEHLEAERHLLGKEEKIEASTTTVAQHLPSPIIRIYLLGQFRVEHQHDGEWRAVDSRTWHRRRARALLGCLLSHAGRRLGREQVMELLWPDLDIDLAANRLNGAVHELRQILEPNIARPAASRMLRLERDMLELADSTQIWVDAEEFENLVKEANIVSDARVAEQLFEEAANLYQGSYLLEELYSEWATPRRDALQRAWVGLLLKLADLQAEQDAYTRAIETLDRLRTADLTNETALQRLMVLLTQLDRRGEALRVYNQHVQMLKRDYEGEPLPETIALYEKLRKGHIPPRMTILAKNEPQLSKAALILPSTPSTQREETPPEIPFIRPLFQLGRHNQSPLIGRDGELNTIQHMMLSIEEAATIERTATQLHLKDEETPGIVHRPLSASSSRPQHTHFLLLKGEAGIGKTRLAEELSLDAYTRGWTVAWSRSYEQEGTIPYRPWTELLRTLLPSTTTFSDLVNMVNAFSTPHSQHASPLKLERLSALLPELSPYTSASIIRPASPIPHEQERLHLWEATLGLIGAFSRSRPLLLVLDDFHWADDSSIELLTYLIHHLRNQRVLLVGTCRDAELAPQHKLRTLMADLQREQAIAIISVLPLTHSQISTLLSHLPHDIVRSIQTQASGNPFFAEELARFVGATYNGEDPIIPIPRNKQVDGSTRTSKTAKNSPSKGELDRTRPYQSLPEAIAAVLERRLSRLSGGCQLLLGKAAVLGGSFELSQLLPMASEHDEDTILDLLEEALRAGLLTEEGTGAYIIYHFWHPLIISHLYGRLSAARRALLHRKAAETIRAANASHPENAAAAIVHHLTRGGGEALMVAYYAEIAGKEAYSLAAYSESQQYYLQAVRALTENEIYSLENNSVHTHIQQVAQQTLSKTAIADPLRVCRLLERVAEYSMVLGTYEEARYLLQCILELRTGEHFLRQVYKASTPHEAEKQYEAQIQALLWREISITWSLTGEYEHAYSCYSRGKEVMLRAGVHSGAAWACLHLQYGALLRLKGSYHEARRYLQEALNMLELAAQQGSFIPPEVESGHATRAFALAGLENTTYKDFPTRTERALSGDPFDIGYAHERLGIVAASLGQLNEALQHMHTALTIYEQSELVSEMARVCSNLGAAYITKGEHKSAREYMHRSLELAERIGDTPNMANTMHNLGDVAQRTGDLLEAEQYFMQSLALSERVNDREGISWCCSTLADAQENQGKLQEATTSILRAITIGRAIKNTRCIRFALIRMAELRITQANTQVLLLSDQHNLLSTQRRRLLLRAKATLQRAIALEDMEMENIIDGRYLLAKVYFLLGDTETALHMAWQTLKKAQEYETNRMRERIYSLLGLILATHGDLKQADQCFELAIQVCRERDFHLDCARALQSYGLTLIQRSTAPFDDHSDTTATTKAHTYQKGLSYLYEARTIFASCHAAVDLTMIEHYLATIETTHQI